MRHQKLCCALLILLLASILPSSAYDSVQAGTPQTISGGDGVSFVIDGGGSLWAWGSNEWGQLGDGTTEDRSTPVKVLEGVRSVSAGEGHTYAVMEDNTLWAWGRNVSNAFTGQDDLSFSLSPVRLMDGVQSASTGTCTHLAVKTDGTLWAWGRYVGDRTNKQRSEPVHILSNVTAACTGFGHSLALKADGSLWAWGQNNNGEVGNGTTRERPTPVKVMTNVVQMSAGYGFSAAVKSDGTLWTWGRNWQGELGDGTTESRSTPAQVLDQTAAVFTGNNNCYALRTGGSLWAWGSNVCGAVGDCTIEDRLLPVQVTQGAAEAGAGWDHILVKLTDGTLWTWGSNLCGQLGSGESGFYNSNTYLPRFSSSPLLVAEVTGTGLSTWELHYSPAGWAQAAYEQANERDFLPRCLCTPPYSRAITRGEFCALAVRFYESFTGRTIEARISFSDTRDEDVEKAAGLGVVSGVGEGLFAPNDPLDREQAAVILSNLARALEHPLPQAQHTFSDPDFSPWAQDAVGQVQSAGIMSGSGNGLFSPQGTYTREQSVVTIMNLYRFMQT